MYFVMLTSIRTNLNDLKLRRKGPIITFVLCASSEKYYKIPKNYFIPFYLFVSMEDFTLIMTMVSIIATFIIVAIKPKQNFLALLMVWMLSGVGLVVAISDKTLQTDVMPPYPLMILLNFFLFIINVGIMITNINGSKK